MKITEFRGRDVYGDPGDELYRRWTDSGEWEPEVTEWIEETTTEGDVCVDMGSHIGLHTITLRQSCGDAGEVLAFEPNPEIIPALRRNVADWDNVHVIPAAIGREAGITDLDVKRKSDIVTTVDVPMSTHHTHWVVMLPTFVLPTPIDVLKMDIEGAEEHVIQQIPWDSVRHAVIEMHGFAYDDAVRDRLITWLEMHGDVRDDGRHVWFK